MAGTCPRPHSIASVICTQKVCKLTPSQFACTPICSLYYYYYSFINKYKEKIVILQVIGII